ncbi:hypothetical protein [Infirmifilum uzonense]|uniref:hypothetical protein n=1 Tax=Infirmifilum uzonense TaxID=1550241 RepID=UPI00069A898E|nr:hypothetical protein [Infirmifilum uzonense]
MATARKTSTALLLALLAITAFAAAAVTLTNITEWHIKAQYPPIVKVAGADTGTLVTVTTSSASDGTNRTVITLTGFTGDPTRYDEVLKICNKDASKSYTVQLVYKQVLSGDWTYVQYLKLWLGSSGPITITSSVATGTATATVGPSSCVSVPAEVLVKPNAPTGTELISIEVDVVSTG